MGLRRRGVGAVTTTLTKIVTARDFAAYMIPEATGMADYLEERDAWVRWAGRGAVAVGLEGAATAEALARLLAGEDPETVSDRAGGEVVSSSKRKIMGFEWSYTPPKSVSVLWAVADAELRAQIEEAADVATAAALVQVEEAASWTRRRRGGRLVREETEGLLAVVVPHTSSREGDPHLHHHVVVANQVRRRSDGGWCTPDGRGIYGALAWSGTVWGMVLRAELSRRLGVEWEPLLEDGRTPEIVGVPAGLVERWSQRAVEVAAERERRGQEGDAWSGKWAARNTRRLKDMSETRPQKFRRWRAEALAVGVGAVGLVAEVTGREVEKPWPVVGLAERVALSLDVRLTMWDRVEWLTTAAEQAKARGGVDELLDVADVELGEGGRFAVQLPDDPDGSTIGGRWTTTFTLARERRVVRRATEMSEPARPLFDPWAVDRQCRAAGLDPEQAKAVWDIALSGRRFSTLAAPAGTGKTRTMGALAEVMRRRGIEPRALAPAQQATDGLADSLGIDKAADESRRRNISRFLAGVRRAGHPDPGGEEWWIVDEASMVDSRHWDELLGLAAVSGTRVLAIGDPAQLGAVGPGGLFAHMVHHPDLPTAELEKVWRMDAEWERQASLQLRAMNPEATDAYLQQGRIRNHGHLEELLDDLAAARIAGRDVVVMAGSNRQVDALNDQMQARLIAGRGPADQLVIRWDDEAGSHERTVGVGDRVRTRRNDYDLAASKGGPVTNGAIWEVTHVRDGGLWVRSDQRGHLYLPPGYLAERDEDTGRPFVELGYASTVHSAQGRTVDQAVMVIDQRTEAELLYVGMTRGRTTNIAVAAAGDDDGPTLFAAALQHPSADTRAVLDVIAHRERANRAWIQQEIDAWEAAEREHAEVQIAQQEARRAAREQAELEQIEREEQEAAEARRAAIAALVADLEDGLTAAAVAAAAEDLDPGMQIPDLNEAIAAYSRVQEEKARAWARSLQAGYPPGEVGRAALRTFAVGGNQAEAEQMLAREYAAAAQAKIDNAGAWMNEQGLRWNDDEQGDLAETVAARYGITNKRAERMVASFDEHYRNQAVAQVEALADKGYAEAQARPQVIEGWAGTRYIGDALAALQERYQPPQRETPDRGRGGPGLGWP